MDGEAAVSDETDFIRRGTALASIAQLKNGERRRPRCRANRSREGDAKLTRSWAPTQARRYIGIVMSSLATDASAPRTRRVLIIDDHQDTAESMAACLRVAGHRVEVAFDGLAGLEVARRFLPD